VIANFHDCAFLVSALLSADQAAALAADLAGVLTLDTREAVGPAKRIDKTRPHMPPLAHGRK
jgi:hypothetical protein